jgi:hypothetical protein
MKRFITFLLLFAAFKVAGQTTGYLRFDTVKIMKQNGTCELYIINKTKDSLGLLTNIGGGLTQFIKSRSSGDSLFVGLDTIAMTGTDKLDSLHIYTATSPSPDTLYSYKNGDSTLVGLLQKGGSGGISQVVAGVGLTNVNDSTLDVDTLAISTRAWRHKGDDSVAGVLRQVVIDSAAAIRAAIPDSLDDLADVLISSLTTGDALVWNGTTWSNSAVAEILGGIFADPDNTIYTAIVRPDASSGSIVWDLVLNSQHTNYGFGDWVEATTTGFNLYYPTASQVQTIIMKSDETLGTYGVEAGVSFGLNNAVATVTYDKGTQGGYIRGTSTTTITKDNEMTSWTASYTPTTGTVLLTFPTGLPLNPSLGSGVSIVYEGFNNWHKRNITSGIGTNQLGFQLLDAGGNVVTDTLTNTDYFKVVSKYTSARTTVNGITLSVAATTFYTASSNFWVIAVVKRNPASPGEITNISVTPSSTQLALDWDDATLATGYEVDRSLLPNSSFSNVYTGADSDFTDTGLTNGVTYYYRIRSTAAGSLFSAYWKASGVPN